MAASPQGSTTPAAITESRRGSWCLAYGTSGPTKRSAWPARAAERPHPYIVGFALAGDERVPPTEFAEAFRIAADSGLGCTVHAGEWQGPESIRQALELPVTRLDHGVRAIEDPSLVTEIVERGITLNTCPTSNVVLGVYASFAEHPLPQLRAAGARVTLGSDDPPYFGATLGGEYDVCSEHFGWDDQRLQEVTVAALEAAFCDEALRTELRARTQHALGCERSDAVR